MTDAPFMLTTIDNPYDPFEQFDEWYAYDVAKGYHTSALLARVSRISDELSSSDYNVELNKAIEEIITLNPTGLYIKTYEGKFIKNRNVNLDIN